MGTSELREAFITAAGGKLTVTSLTMDYDHGPGPNHQVIEIEGFRAPIKEGDSATPFHARSNPLHPSISPMSAVVAMAHALLKEPTNEKTSATQH